MGVTANVGAPVTHHCTLPLSNVASRVSTIRGLLAPLCLPGAQVAAKTVPGPAGTIAIGAYSGSQPSDTDYRGWHFNTFVPRITGTYFELWRKADAKGRFMFMDQAYLHLHFRRRDLSKRELILLHCDPNAPPDPVVRQPVAPDAPLRHSEYKRALHVHVSLAAFPLSHAHVDLQRGSDPTGFMAVDELGAAQVRAVELLREQVLRLFLHELNNNENKVIDAVA